jgi:hypothetical protein
MIEEEPINRFATLVDMPDFLDPWRDRFYEPLEIELIDLLGKDGLWMQAPFRPSGKQRWAVPARRMLTLSEKVV